jgi:hypothetical protein
MSRKTKNEKIEFAVTEENDGKVHVRPVVNGEIIDTPVEEIINPNEEIDSDGNTPKDFNGEGIINSNTIETFEETVEPTEVSSNEEISEEQEVETETEETVVQEVAKPVVTEEKPNSVKRNNKNIDYASRGFSSIEEALSFPDTDYFKGLGKEDKEEYLNWLKN